MSEPITTTDVDLLGRREAARIRPPALSPSPKTVGDTELRCVFLPDGSILVADEADVAAVEWYTKTAATTMAEPFDDPTLPSYLTMKAR